MNIRLQYELEFLAGVYYQDQLQMNSYTVSLNLLTKTTAPIDTNIALERIKCFVFNELESTVFFGPDHHDRAEMFAAMGVNVTTLPDEPVDQIIGIMLYQKLNAIMQDRMLVTDLNISSILGDKVWYQHDEDDAVGPFDQPGWWNRADLVHNNIELAAVVENVVKVNPNPWHELHLNWPEEIIEKATGNVVFTNFKRDENKPTR